VGVDPLFILYPEIGAWNAALSDDQAQCTVKVVQHAYTAKYTKISSGYMGQLVDWPEVVTEGRNLEDCRALLEDALQEMILAYRKQKKELPVGRALLEQIPVQI
jgi:predicted RNase H-like HicB family nuclease